MWRKCEKHIESSVHSEIPWTTWNFPARQVAFYGKYMRDYDAPRRYLNRLQKLLFSWHDWHNLPRVFPETSCTRVALDYVSCSLLPTQKLFECLWWSISTLFLRLNTLIYSMYFARHGSFSGERWNVHVSLYVFLCTNIYHYDRVRSVYTRAIFRWATAENTSGARGHALYFGGGSGCTWFQLGIWWA